MAEDTDYNRLVEKNIAEIKEELEDNPDIDLRDVLKAEKQNKDRKTLKQWLEEKIEERDENEETEERYDKEEVDEGYEKEVIDEMDFSEQESVWSLPVTNFVFGLVIGLAVAALFIYTQGGSLAIAGGAAISPQQAQDGVEELFRAQASQIPDNVSFDITSGQVDESQYADLYMVPITLTLAGQQQESQLFVTKESGLIFQQGINMETGEPVPSSAAPQQPGS